MATYEEHCQECIEKLKQPFGPVHKWLDELQPTLGPQHRAVRHNEKGIERVRSMFGDEAAKAARIHIERDEGGFEKEGSLWKPMKRITRKTYLTEEEAAQDNKVREQIKKEFKPLKKGNGPKRS